MVRSLLPCNWRGYMLACVLLLVNYVFSIAQNPIVTENALTGNPKSEWDISGSGDPNIQGFATDISVNKGQTVRFKISVTGGGTYAIRIYRLGYYKGNGARLITTLGTAYTGVKQPEPNTNTTTGLVDCSNWSESASWLVPSTAVSGVYIARLTRSTGSSHIVFIVRDDAANSPILFKTSDATWQAYNAYGGNSLDVGSTSYPAGHATKGSYNRPFITRDGGGGGGAMEDWLFNAEYPMIRFLERNGYNVSYTTDVDMERDATPITPSTHKIFLSVGHDEYWSANERTRVENARNAGVHLAFFSGNEVYWKTRWEDNYRTLVCYKEGTLGENVCGTKCDPSTEWTGLWREGCAYPSGGACKPENALTGQISWSDVSGAITVPGTYRSLRFWRNTSVASQGANQTTTFPSGTLGYEWNYEQYPASMPNGRIILSSTTVSGLTHKLSLYRHSSGALVFGAGTVQWSWGLDNIHDRGSAAASTAMQQATVNLFADMGVQPGSLMTGLVAATASTDVQAPVPVISSPLNGATVTANTAINISGTATDAGGVLAGIEVSVDGGNTWTVATGTTSWSFSWTPATSGTANIRVRGFDDSGNMSVPGAAGSSTNINVTVSGGAQAGTYSVFQPSVVPQITLENDGAAVSLGMKFRATQNGYVTGVRYYKGAGATGTHTGTLWSSTGTKLAEVVFANETSSGWQQMLFSTPVSVVANTTYVVSYHSSSGDYCSSNPYFTAAVVNGPLRGLANGEDGANGLYIYANTPAFPTSNYGSSNYFVDVVFTNVVDNTPPTVSSVTPAANATGIAQSAVLNILFSEDMTAASISTASITLRDAASNTISGTVTYNAATRTATFTAAAALSYQTVYTARVLSGTNGVKDAAGNALAADYTWSFTTLADQVPPTVTGVSPAANAVTVNVNTAVTVTFNEAMAAASLSTSSFELRNAANALVPATVTYNVANRTASLTPTAPLAASTVYTARVAGGAGGATDIAGNALASAYTWSFTTEAEPDLVPPVVSTVAPANGSGAVAITTALTVTFNEDMLAASIGTGTVELRGPGNTLVPATVTYNAANRTATLTPSASLAYFTGYTATVKSGTAGVKDAAGNALATDYVWSFTSVADLVPPQVSSITPANGAGSVAVNTTVSIVFSEAMTNASISSGSIELRDASSTLVNATISYNAATRTATLTPAASLVNATVYTVIVKSGAGGVKDAAGNALAGDYIAYFTTLSNSVSLFSAATVPATFGNDGTALTLGVKFRATQAGLISGIRFYKRAGSAGTNTAILWSSTGTKLAEAVSGNETASGWQQVLFTTPVSIAANTTYVASYHSSSGDYAIANPFFTTAVVNGPLRGLASGEDGPNGVYRYGATPAFPNSNYETSNYYVDVLFSTGAVSDVTPPQVSSIVPANNATGVSLATVATVTFNEAMNIASVSSSTIELRTAAGVLVPSSVSYDAASRTATITPAAVLSTATTYRITVKSGTSGVKDVAGNALAADFTASFATITDNVPPFIVGQNERDGMEYAGNTIYNIILGVSELLDTASVTSGAFEIKTTSNTIIPIVVRYLGASNDVAGTESLIEITSASPLPYNSSFTLTAKTGVGGIRDVAGNTIITPYSLTFFTFPDSSPPWITQYSPVPDATGVSRSLTVTAVFSEPLQPSSVSASTVELRDALNNLVPVNITYSSTTNTITIGISDSLQYQTRYSVIVKGGANGIKDMAGNYPASDYTWGFTTRADLVAPQINSVTPVSGSGGVAVSIAPTAIASEALDISTVNNNTVELKDENGNIISSAVSYDAALFRILITPAISLPYSSNFIAVIKGGNGGVKDLAGNTLASDYSWSFTTMAEPDVTAPVVNTVTPVNGATDVLRNIFPAIVFSEPVDEASLQNAVSFTAPGNTAVPFTFTYNNATRTVTLTPSSLLQYNTVYSIVVKSGTTGVKDLAGNTLASDYSWGFTTLADVVAPVVTSTVPAQGSSNVSVSLPIRISFSEPLDAATVSSSTVSLRGLLGLPVSAAITYDAAQQTIVITPASNLSYLVGYSVVVSTGIKDLAGNALAGDFTLSFTTESFLDLTPPQVSSVLPANGSTAVSTNAAVQIVFNEDMQPASINATSIELRDNAATLIPATVSYNAVIRTATLTPSAHLGYLAVYNVKVKSGSSGVKDDAGNALSADYNWNFTTEADMVAPTVTQAIPAQGTTDVNVNTSVNATFSEGMSPASLTTSTIELRDAASQLVPFTINYYSGTFTVTLTPTAPLAYSTTYTAKLKGGASGVKDAVGNALVADYSWSFTTAADLAAPTVVSTTPAANATSVALNTAPAAIMSETLTPASVSGSTVELRNSANTLIAATVAYNNTTKTITLTPTSVLNSGTVYTMTIKGGASGVKDAAGNALAANYTWSFTTVSASYTVFQPATVPAGSENDGTALTLGMKFRSTQAGYITAIRYYKPAGATGSRTGNLWSSTGTKLAEILFTGETSSGWQQMPLASPVAINANTTYVVSYHSSSGDYPVTNPYFTSAVVNGPLRGLANGEDGPNGLYRYTATPAFPNSNYGSSNYWVDVVFAADSGPDQTPPSIVALSPGNGAANVSTASAVTINFNETISPASITSANFELRNAANQLVPATLSVLQNQAVLTPSAALNYSSVYTASVKGGSTGVKDVAGNALLRDSVWTFTTADPPPPPITYNGPGGPVLVLYSASNPYSRYTIEMLRAEGLNYYLAKDIADVTAADLTNADVVVLGEVSVTSAQATQLSNWVNNGGTLVAFRPSAELSSLLGITKVAGSLADQYLLVNTSSGPGVGIVNQTIQYHGTADLYTLNGATSVATLYSSATTATTYPAVTQRDVGSNGGRAIAFTYDLPRSVVYTRQGNPAWAGQKRDGTSGPIRPDDLFYGGSATDWVNLNKVAIPQADEQQRLLTNIILQGNLHRKPLPRFWFLPRGLKAAIVMTGDDHATGGTSGRFDQYLTLGPNTPADVADWKAVRGTSYLYTGSPISNAQATAYEAQGFELSLHTNTNCENFTSTSLNSSISTQLTQLRSQLPGISAPQTHRTHCMVWSDWATAAKVQAQNGIRMDVNYYYWPGSWVQNRPGMFTGSGMPMRFADLDGTMVDIYQATTQMTDESGIALPWFCDQLLDKALGPEGYYGVFVTNMHTDTANHIGSNRIIASAQARQVPIISARQMLTWLDGRNNSYFGTMTWNNNQLSFPATALAGARNLKGMLPVNAATGQLVSITRNGSAVSYTTETIKGITYAFFDITTGTNNYIATYSNVAGRGVSEEPVAATLAVVPSRDSVLNAKAALQVDVLPNPSTDQFTLVIKGTVGETVTVRITDITGRIKERHEAVPANGVLKLGASWKGGTYFAEVIQGDQRQVIKLVKLN